MMKDVFDSDVVEEIRDEQTWQEKVDNAPGRVMVEFFVTWCPHCQREAPVYDEVAPEIMAEGTACYHANAEVMWQKGEVYDITETPSFILVEDGKLIAKYEGFMTAEQMLRFARGDLSNLPSFEESLRSSGFPVDMPMI